MIFPTQIRLLVREHLYKPLSGRILTLGRQTVRMTYRELLDLFEGENYIPSKEIFQKIEISYDDYTRFRKGSQCISDQTLFDLFGIEKLDSMDISDYENASIIHDLNFPVPYSLHGQYDFILDAGSFDHMFDLQMAFENVVRMLKPDGRILHWNASSNFSGAAYLSFGPDLFKDFYVFNKFKDCKVYLVEEDVIDQPEGWDFYEFEKTDENTHFRSSRMQMVIVLAEKGEFSTYYKMPIQRQYRDSCSQEEYDSLEKIISLSKRPFLSGDFSSKESIQNFEGLKYVGKI